MPPRCAGKHRGRYKPAATTPVWTAAAPEEPPASKHSLRRADVELVHGRVDAFSGDAFDGVGGLFDGDVHLGALALAEAVQDVVGAALLGHGLPDAQPHP